MAANNIDKTSGIGWDIGIKNLAYCILEPKYKTCNTEYILFNNNYYDIIHWKDISLVSQIESNLHDVGEVSLINTTLKCCITKNKINEPIAICGKNAFYCSEQINADGTYKGYCKNHFKKSGIARMPEIHVKKCYIANCDGKTSQVLKSHIYMGYCKKHITEMCNGNSTSNSNSNSNGNSNSASNGNSTSNSNSTSNGNSTSNSAIGVRKLAEFLKINRSKTTSKIDINHLGLALFQELDKIKDHILDPNIILLENQPVLKNPTMKTMQIFLYSYYLIRCLEINKGLDNKHLQCYTASKKLDLIKFFPQIEQTRIETIIGEVKSGYQKNKKMAILMMEYLLKGNTKWLSFFQKHNKQDDLADSFLMTLHYFEKNNLDKLKKDILKESIKTEKIANKLNVIKPKAIKPKAIKPKAIKPNAIKPKVIISKSKDKINNKNVNSLDSLDSLIV